MLLLLALGCCYFPCVAFVHLVLMLLVELLTSPSFVLLLLAFCLALLLPTLCCCCCLGCYTSPLLPCANWSTRLGKEKNGRIFNLKINSIILLCFDFDLFFDVFGFV